MNTTDEKPRSQHDNLAGDDAAAIAWLLYELYDLREARSIYQRIPFRILAEHDQKLTTHLADFLHLSPADRPAYIKAIHDDIGQREAVVFLVRAIRAAGRDDEDEPDRARFIEIDYQWPFDLFLGLMLDDGHWLDDYPEHEREAILNRTEKSPDMGSLD